MSGVNTERVLAILSEEMNKAGFATPAGSYFGCREASGIVLHVFSVLGINAVPMEADLLYPDAPFVDSSLLRKPSGHYMVASGNRIMDFALRQFHPATRFPFVTERFGPEAEEIYPNAREIPEEAASMISYALRGSSSSNLELANRIISLVRAEVK